MSTAANYDSAGNANYWSGAFYSDNRSGMRYGVGGTTYQWSNFIMNLSRSNGIFGRSNTVTPESRRCRFLIKY